MADTLRDLAERLGMLKDCECVDGCDRCLRPEMADRQRLPDEAEVRAAIFEAGWPVIIARRIEADFVSLEVCRPSEQRDADAIAGEAAPDKLVLLALLRALEEVRRG